MDSGFEDKQNRVLVMTRNGIYMYISYIRLLLTCCPFCCRV